MNDDSIEEITEIGGGGGVNSAEETIEIGGFIPSFLESGRQPRLGRRQLGRSIDTSHSQSSTNLLLSSTTDELDRVLGIGSIGSAPRKRATDPFADATVSKSLSALPSTSSYNTRRLSVNTDSPAKDIRKDSPIEMVRGNVDTVMNFSDDEDVALDRQINVMRSSIDRTEGPSSSIRPDHAHPMPSTTPVGFGRRRSLESPQTGVVDLNENSITSGAVDFVSRSRPGTMSSSDRLQITDKYAKPEVSAASENDIRMFRTNKHEADQSVEDKIPSDVTEAALLKMFKSVQDSGQQETKVIKSEFEEIKSMLASAASRTTGDSEELKKAQQQIRELETTVSKLTADISRLEDEAAISKLHQSEELKYIKGRHEEELVSKERAHEVAMTGLTRRHVEAVDALKRVHLDDLMAVKERTKDGQALEQLAAQIRSTSGSMRLIEEQLSQRHGNLDLAKEGQMEARERLLADLESKARERAELAEAEAFRLKGLLSHMESMALSLRSQGAEERERLRGEHQRLLSLQTSLEAERVAQHARAKEECIELLRRREEAREAVRLAEETRERALEEAVVVQKRLEADKREFLAHVNKSSAASEVAALRLKDEELRILRLREEVQEQRAALTQQRAMASVDLASAADLRRELDEYRRKVETEKETVDRAAREMQHTKDLLQSKDRDVQLLLTDLQERECAVREGFEKVSVVGESVMRRESELRFQSQQLSLQQMEMERMDDVLTMKRASLASDQRELLKKSFNRLAIENVENRQATPILIAPREIRQPQRLLRSSPEDDMNEVPITRKSDAWLQLKSFDSSGRAVEIKLAQRTMHQAKSKLARSRSAAVEESMNGARRYL